MNRENILGVGLIATLTLVAAIVWFGDWSLETSLTMLKIVVMVCIPILLLILIIAVGVGAVKGKDGPTQGSLFEKIAKFLGAERPKFNTGLFISEAPVWKIFHTLGPDQAGVFINRFTAKKGDNPGWYTAPRFGWGRVCVSIPFYWEMIAIIDLSQEQQDLSFEINPGGEKMKVNVLVVSKVRSVNGSITPEVGRLLITELDTAPEHFIETRSKAAYNTALSTVVISSTTGIQGSADMIPGNFSLIDTAAALKLNALLAHVGFECVNYMTQGVEQAAAEERREQEQRWKALESIKYPDGKTAIEKVNPNVFVITQALENIFGKRGGSKKKKSEEEE